MSASLSATHQGFSTAPQSLSHHCLDGANSENAGGWLHAHLSSTQHIFQVYLYSAGKPSRKSSRQSRAAGTNARSPPPPPPPPPPPVHAQVVPIGGGRAPTVRPFFQAVGLCWLCRCSTAPKTVPAAPKTDRRGAKRGERETERCEMALPRLPRHTGHIFWWSAFPRQGQGDSQAQTQPRERERERERERGERAWKIRVRKHKSAWETGSEKGVPAPSQQEDPPAPFPPACWRVLSQAQPPERIATRKNRAAKRAAAPPPPPPPGSWT
eukprot:COSAG04_NODE_3816_length_2500_cov_9.281549_2_plen_268_part_00